MNEGCLEKGLALAKYAVPITFVGYLAYLRGRGIPGMNRNDVHLIHMIQAWYRNALVLPMFYAFTFGLTSCAAATWRDKDDSRNWIIANNLPRSAIMTLVGSFFGVYFQIIRISPYGFGVNLNRMAQGQFHFTGPLHWKRWPLENDFPVQPLWQFLPFPTMGEDVANECLLQGDLRLKRNLSDIETETATSQCDAIAFGKRGQRSELRDCFFKCYVVVLAVLVWTGYTLLVAYTRQKTPKSELYSSSTVVFFSECTKLAITLFFIYRDCDFSITTGKQLLDREYFSKPLEILKMSVPSIAYALQNNLDFVALSNLEASVYQVTTQLKIPSTAVFMMLFLGRRFSMKRWVAILLLCAGVASVELDSLESEGQIGTKSGAGNRFVGIFAVFATCVTAGFAGVYFEKMLKDGSSTPFWIRNLQMYSCGVCSAFVGCFLKDYSHIKENGLFYGYNVWVLAIVLSLSLGGIYISLIMKHLDNLYKSFASSISIVAVTLLSLLIFENTFIGTFFVFGALTVCFALVLYNSVDQ
uniref:EamA domain-containing protein n=1 Tax=Globodera pallida TaxID=36090 RepID=A0A183BY08_GLOPA